MKKNFKNILMIFTFILVAIIGIKQNTAYADEWPAVTNLWQSTEQIFPNGYTDNTSRGQQYKYSNGFALFCTSYSSYLQKEVSCSIDNDSWDEATMAGVGYIIKQSNLSNFSKPWNNLEQVSSDLPKYFNETLAINSFLNSVNGVNCNELTNTSGNDNCVLINDNGTWKYKNPYDFITNKQKYDPILQNALLEYERIDAGTVPSELLTLTTGEPKRTLESNNIPNEIVNIYRIDQSNITSSFITISIPQITSDTKIDVYLSETGQENNDFESYTGNNGENDRQLSKNRNSSVFNITNKKYIKLVVKDYDGSEPIKIKIKASGVNTYDIAKNYNCGTFQIAAGVTENYQTLTPNKTENVTKTADDSKYMILSMQNTPEPEYPKLVINKQDSNDNSPLKNAIFTVTKDNEDFSTLTTGDNGKTDELEIEEAGTYCITETKAPRGYFIDKTKHCFTVTENNSVVSVDLKNNDKLSYNNNVVTFTTSNTKNQITITKTDSSENNVLTGAHLVLKTQSGNIIDEWDTTNEAHTIQGLTGGKTYYLVETVAPSGYILREVKNKEKDAQKIKIPEDMTEPRDIIFKNYKIVLNISKIDPISEKKLSGAHFQIIDPNTNEVVKVNGVDLDWYSDLNKAKKIELIPAGTYLLRELQAPAGYVIMPKDIEFTINSNGTVTYNEETLDNNSTLTITNAKNKIVISKRDITGTEELPGAKLQVTDATGKVVKDIDGNELSWTSTNEAHVINGLRKGKYYLVETQAKDGYVRATESIVFTVDAYGIVKVNNVTMEDSVVIMTNAQTKVSISKQDVTTKQELPGAHLQITDENGNVILLNGEELKWISTEEPHVIEGLGQGTYYIVETTSPDGYTLNEEKVKFTIDEDGVISGDTVMYNTPIVDVPSTLSVQSILITLAGITFVGLGVGLYFYGVKKQKEI